MKLHTEYNEVTKIGNFGDNGKFKINASAKAFKILSDGLYTDKIKACIRELSCNAQDSHVAAGKDTTPIKVHMPTRLEPFFSVQDYGLGLSHDDVMSLYTTYFESTKTESNDFVGALGLGSKSPFSYVDSFTVASVFDKIKRSYVAILGADGSPEITLMGEEVVCEPNGVTVQFPVRPDDINTFSTYTYLFNHFPVCPNINVEYKQASGKDTVLEGDGWSLQEHVNNNRHNYDTAAKALQGLVEYPIEVTDALKNLIGLKCEDNDIPSADIMQILTGVGGRWASSYYSFILDFPLGSLDVAASREALSYDDATMNAIADKAIAVYKEAQQTIQNELASCDTWWDAHVRFSELTKSGEWSFINSCKYDGKALVANTPVLELYNPSRFETQCKDRYSGKYRKVKMNHLDFTPLQLHLHSENTFYLLDGTDKVSYYKLRVKEHDDENNSQRLLYIIKTPEGITVEALRDYIQSVAPGFPNIVFIRDLPKPVIDRNTQSVASDKVPFNIPSVRVSKNIGNGTYYGLTSEVTDKGGFYAETNADTWVLPNKDKGRDIDSLSAYGITKTCLEILGRSDEMPAQVFVVNQKEAPYLRGHAEWKPVNDLVKEAMAAVFDGQYSLDALADAYEATGNGRSLSSRAKLVSQDHRVKEMVDKLEARSQVIPTDVLENVSKVLFNMPWTHEEFLEARKKAQEKDLTFDLLRDKVQEIIEEDYPLLNRVRSLYGGEDEELAIYVKAKQDAMKGNANA